ncbi:MAG: class D beta-lactamase [Balneolaceae bacterium]|nr:MAG: class D beta-lactamase [Balneolaceae bacterium]
MNTLYIISTFIFFFSCIDKNSDSNKIQEKKTEFEIIVPQFQTIIDSAHVEGAILIFDLEDDKYYSNDFMWSKSGHLPASTFKITNSIIALETGTVENENSLFEWDGEKRMLVDWEQDLVFREAFHYSCVPCYQEIARNIGKKNMKKYLDTLDYGNMDVHSNNIDLFWLEGESRITQFQQIDFLKRFYQSKLPISQRTESIMKKMMVIEENESFRLSAKTGWSIINGINNGWFVGYIETNNKTFFFATNIEPKQTFDMDLFPVIRKDLTFHALEQMEIIKTGAVNVYEK